MQTPCEKSLIFGRISRVMSEVGVIEKTRKNTQGSGYMFRGIDDLYNALQGSLAKNEVFFAPTVVDQRREERTSKSGGNLIYTILTMAFTFYAPDGSSFTATTVGEAMDSGDKSANKAMSAALKYALLQVFCIPTDEDNDTENSTHHVAARGTRQIAGPPQGKPQGVRQGTPQKPAEALSATTRGTGQTAKTTSHSSTGEDFKDFRGGPITK